MEILKENSRNIIVCIAELVLGIILFLKPTEATTVIIIVIGIVAVVLGIVNIISYFRTSPQQSSLHRSLAAGLMEVLAGCFCIFQYEWFFDAFSVIARLYGVVLIFAGLDKLQWTVDLIRLRRSYWHSALLDTVFTLVIAMIIFINPFSSAKFLWSFIAIALIVSAVIDIITIIMQFRDRPDPDIIDNDEVEVAEDEDVDVEVEFIETKDESDE